MREDQNKNLETKAGECRRPPFDESLTIVIMHFNEAITDGQTDFYILQVAELWVLHFSWLLSNEEYGQNTFHGWNEVQRERSKYHIKSKIAVG